MKRLYLLLVMLMVAGIAIQAQEAAASGPKKVEAASPYPEDSYKFVIHDAT